MPECDQDPVRRAAEHLRAPVDFGPSFEAQVMARVLAEARASTPRSWPGVGSWARGVGRRGWVVAGFGSLVAAVAIIAGVAGLSTRAPRPDPAGSAVVRFHLVAPEASSVRLVGDFDDWRSAGIPLVRAPGGAWSATVRLPPGRYNYAFVVDGVRWVADPHAPRASPDDFGRPNSVLLVGGSSL